MDKEHTINNYNHSINVLERKNILVTGVKKIESFDDENEEILGQYININNLSIIKKALYNFIDDGYFILNYADADTIIAKILLKEHTTNKELFVKELYNELFNESIRFDVMKQTKNIRELILGRALYSTCIDTEKNENEEKTETREYKPFFEIKALYPRYLFVFDFPFPKM